jgi:hypothetical protein
MLLSFFFFLSFLLLYISLPLGLWYFLFVQELIVGIDQKLVCFI